jgi:hypothetical protein
MTKCPKSEVERDELNKFIEQKKKKKTELKRRDFKDTKIYYVLY